MGKRSQPPVEFCYKKRKKKLKAESYLPSLLEKAFWVFKEPFLLCQPDYTAASAGLLSSESWRVGWRGA